MDESPDPTAGAEYTRRLSDRPGASWKRLVPDPYRRNIRRLCVGRTLDIGCGVGRCLAFLDGAGVGVDHNPTSVDECRRRGFEAYTPDEFATVDRGMFDTVLVSHVLEHMDEDAGVAMLESYLGSLRIGGRLVVVTPQAAGQRSDPTHVRLMGETEIAAVLARLAIDITSTRSFPFPRVVGRIFIHNETVVTGVLRGGGGGGD